MFFSKIISSISVSTKENDIAKEILAHIKSLSKSKASGEIHNVSPSVYVLIMQFPSVGPRKYKIAIHGKHTHVGVGDNDYAIDIYKERLDKMGKFTNHVSFESSSELLKCSQSISKDIFKSAEEYYNKSKPDVLGRTNHST